MTPAVRGAVERALASPVLRASPLAGGDINQAFAVELGDGRRAFVKTNAHAPAGMFAAEAHGLGFIAEPGALAVPQVLACSDEPGAAFLALELLEPGRRVRDFDERLGRGLATLHRASPGAFGLARANFVGRLPQDNRPAAAPGWAAFYAERRIAPQMESAAARGLLPADLRRALEGCIARMADLVGPEEPPARLHGDLWGGNLHVTAAGEPALIDPAAYGGHREIDLAMMQLFGGFSDRVFDAYHEAWPLDGDWRERVPLYQLYPLLVHVNLFGGVYVAQLAGALRRV